MSVEMATPPTHFPIPFDKEHEIVDAIQLSDKPLYIRSKGSDVHVGTKIIFEIQNENDIEKLQPLIKSINLGQSSSDLSTNNIITEVKGKQSVHDKSAVIDDKNRIKSDIGSNLQNSNSCSGILSTDSSMSLNESVIAPSNSVRDDTSLLLTPNFFQNVDKQCENPKQTDSASASASRFNLRADTIAHCTSDFPTYYNTENKPLKLIMPVQCSQYNSQMFSLPQQKSSFTTTQNQYPQTLQHSSTGSRNSYSSQGSAFFSPTDFNPNTSATYHSESTVLPHIQHPLAQTSFSLPFESSICSPSHNLDVLPRVKIIDELPRKSGKNERSNDDWIPLGKNYMEERNFMLAIFPGIFYDTLHGILVEMENGCSYDIILANNNSEACDIDLYVDMELVYRTRLEAHGKSAIDGPKNRREKFVFLRSFDAPPEAGIISGHERNGQIKAVFKPIIIKSDQLEERRRAWSEDSVSCSQFLSQTIGNITAPILQSPVASSLPSYTNERYRSGSLCSGATALQGRQREKYFEVVKPMKVDENKIVILQLRLVARKDDPRRPSNSEPIVPLVTKMPPPLSF